jgi:hypothetical protein
MANDEQACYVYIQLPGTMETVPCASLKVRAVGAGAFEGAFTYGKRNLARPEVVALDPFHLPLSTRLRSSRSSRASPVPFGTRVRMRGAVESFRPSCSGPKRTTARRSDRETSPQPARSLASATASLDRIGLRPMAKLNASSNLPCASGRMALPTSAQPSELRRYNAGTITTPGIGRIKASAVPFPCPGSPRTLTTS